MRLLSATTPESLAVLLLFFCCSFAVLLLYYCCSPTTEEVVIGMLQGTSTSSTYYVSFMAGTFADLATQHLPDPTGSDIISYFLYFLSGSITCANTARCCGRREVLPETNGDCRALSRLLQSSTSHFGLPARYLVISVQEFKAVWEVPILSR
jgi:hypothetical protein